MLGGSVWSALCMNPISRLWGSCVRLSRRECSGVGGAGKGEPMDCTVHSTRCWRGIRAQDALGVASSGLFLERGHWREAAGVSVVGSSRLWGSSTVALETPQLGSSQSPSHLPTCLCVTPPTTAHSGTPWLKAARLPADSRPDTPVPALPPAPTHCPAGPAHLGLQGPLPPYTSLSRVYSRHRHPVTALGQGWGHDGGGQADTSGALYPGHPPHQVMTLPRPVPTAWQ